MLIRYRLGGMTATLIALNVIMAVALWWKPGCKRFAAIQCAQLLQIYPQAHTDLFAWITWYHFNAAVNIIAFCVASKLPVARWMMLLWSGIVECFLSNRDCAFQLMAGQGFPSDAIYWLGNVILFVLLFYALRQPTLWLKERYARRFARPTSRRSCHSTAHQAASARPTQ